MTALYIISAFFAYFVKGVTGFASGLIFSSVLSFKLPTREIAPIELILTIPANFIMAWQGRKGIVLRKILPLCAVVLIGLVPGTLFLKYGDQRMIKIFLGALIMVLGIEMFFRSRAEKRESNPYVLGAIGFVSGILCGLFGIGAFLTAYISRTTKNTSDFKANLCFVFIVENLCRIALYAAAGFYTQQMLMTILYLVPVMAVGLALGMLTSKYISEKLTHIIIMVFLIISGAMLIVNNVFFV